MRHNIVSFRLAFEGIRHSFKTQINFKIHTFFASIAFLLGLLLGISYFEWIVLVLIIILVYVAEMINTSIESMTDLITSEHRKTAKVAKDVSAGMVLMTAVGSLLVGSLLFLPKLMIFFK